MLGGMFLESIGLRLFIDGYGLDRIRRHATGSHRIQSDHIQVSTIMILFVPKNISQAAETVLWRLFMRDCGNGDAHN